MSFISKAPVKLIDYEDNGWKITVEAIQLLSKLNKPIKVLGIAGRYRSGKSHILNKFLGVEQGGFNLGHTVKGCTRGIWMWGKDTGNEITLTLDTEGLNDIGNNATFDSKLFSLVLMLSSYLVLNLVSVVDEQTIQMLSFVTNLSKIIFTQENNQEENEKADFFEIVPPVMFLLRDFVLRLEDGQTLDDYLTRIVKQQPGRSLVIKEKNEIRNCITRHLPLRTIMAIPPPHIDPEVIQNIQKHEAGLSKEFKTSVNDVCSFLRQRLTTKWVKHNSGLVEIKNGDAFVALVHACVTGLNTNKKIETASLVLAVQKHVTLDTDYRETSRSLCRELKTSLVEELRKSCMSKSFKTVEELQGKMQEGVKLLQTKAFGPALNEVLFEFDRDCVYIREILHTQLKLQKAEIEAAEYKRKYEESQRIIEQLRMCEKNAETNVQSVDVNWLEEHERIRKQFEQGSIDEAEKPKIPEEATNAQIEKDTRLLDIVGQQYASYSCKRDKKDKESGGGNKIYVRPYTRSDGTIMKGYWRNK